MTKGKRQTSSAQLRNLPQYRDLTDEELAKVQDQLLHGDLEARIDAVVKTFEKDFDLSNMTVNDVLSLRELARIFIQLKRLNKQLDDKTVDPDFDVNAFERLNRATSLLRDDAAKIQRDLNITRKARESRGEQGVVDFIEELKGRAKQFLAERLSEVYCPKCKMLLCKVWFLYPAKNNRMMFVCGREGCGHKFNLRSTDFTKNKNIVAGPPL